MSSTAPAPPAATAPVLPAWRWIIFGVAALASAVIGLRMAFGRRGGPARRAVGFLVLIVAASWAVGQGGQLAVVILPQAVRAVFAGHSPADVPAAAADAAAKGGK